VGGHARGGRTTCRTRLALGRDPPAHDPQPIYVATMPILCSRSRCRCSRCSICAFTFHRSGRSRYVAACARTYDQMVLARLPKDRVRERTAYEFSRAFAKPGHALWADDLPRRGPAFAYRERCHRADVVYSPGDPAIPACLEIRPVRWGLRHLRCPRTLGVLVRGLRHQCLGVRRHSELPLSRRHPGCLSRRVRPDVSKGAAPVR
jgi:hypothetical protein